MPAISVVIAVRNRLDYLEEALLSLKGQTFDDWEAIIVDDHSEEDVAGVVTSISDDRFRYVRNGGAEGIAASRNLGNDLALAPYIAVADSDDINLPLRLERSMDYLAEHPDTDFLYSALYWFTENPLTVTLHPAIKPFNREALYKANHIAHPTVVYKADIIRELRYTESYLAASDYDMALKFADRRLKFGYIAEPLVLYRRHTEQVSTDVARLGLQRKNAELIKEAHAAFA